MYNCPECHKTLKNKHSLAEHMKRVHGNKPPEPKPEPKSKPESKSQAKKFEVKVEKEEKSTYKCGACDKGLDGEVTPCPHCGAELNWS